MDKKEKVIILVSASAIVLTFVITLYFTFNFFEKKVIPGFTELGLRIDNKAIEFAKTANGNKCLNETLRLYKKDDSFNGQVRAGFFLQRCIKSVKSADDLCKELPG